MFYIVFLLHKVKEGVSKHNSGGDVTCTSPPENMYIISVLLLLLFARFVYF